MNEEGKLQWASISPEVEDGTMPPLFESLIGFGGDDLYAVGMDGVGRYLLM